jgi:hypothetical protein
MPPSSWSTTALQQLSLAGDFQGQEYQGCADGTGDYAAGFPIFFFGFLGLAAGVFGSVALAANFNRVACGCCPTSPGRASIRMAVAVSALAFVIWAFNAMQAYLYICGVTLLALYVLGAWLLANLVGLAWIYHRATTDYADIDHVPQEPASGAATQSNAQQLLVTIPKGVSVGQAMQVVMPNGGIFSVTVPSGTKPGQQMLVVVPSSPYI